MADNTIRTLLAVDGEKEFRNKIKACNSELTTMKATVKTLTAEYETNGKQTKTLKDKKQLLENETKKLQEREAVLKQAISASNDALKKAQDEYTKTVAEKGKDSDESKRLEGIIEKLRIKQNQYKTQLANTNTELVQTRAQIRQLNDEINSHGLKLADIVGKVKSITVETGKLGLAGLKTSLKAVTDEVKLGVEGLTAYAAAVTAAAGAIGTFAVKSGADFEEGMSNVEAISGATADEMQMLTDKADKLGARTKFTAKEASDAFNYMAMAGWKASDMMEGIDGVINLAAASGEELGLVSDIVTDSLTAFKMEAKDAGHYADVLAMASSNANTNVAMMGETFQYCAPIAGAMGYKADDLAVAIGLMANAGIKGSMAGTSLRSVITNLAAPTDAAEAAMDKLGIKITDDEGNMKSFDEVVNQLKTGFEGLSEAEAAASAKAIAGKPGMSGLLAIINASEDDVTQLRNAIDNSTGAAEAMAKIKLDNLKGDFTLLTSATTGLGTAMFEKLNPGLREATQFLTMLVTKVRDAVKFGRQASGVIKDVFANIGVMAERGLAQVADKLPSFLESFNAVFLGITDLIIRLLPQFNSEILPALITGFSGLVNSLVQRFPELLGQLMISARTILDSLIYEVDIIGVGFTLLDELLNGIMENLPALLETGAAALMEFISGIVDRLPMLLDTALEILTMLLDELLDNVDILIKAGLKIIIALAEFVVNSLDKLIPYIPEIINAIIDGLIDNLDLLVQAAVEILIALGTALVESFTMLDDFIKKVTEHIADRFKSTNWLQVGIDIIMGIANGISRVGEVAGGIIDGAVQNVKDFFTNGFSIHSPSKWARDVIGKNIVKGQVEGIEEETETQNRKMFTALSSFGKLVTSSASDIVAPAGAGGVSVNLYGNITLNNTDGDIDNLITDIETRIYERQLGRGR